MKLWLAGLSLLAVLRGSLADCECPQPEMSHLEKLCSADFVAKVIITSEFGIPPGVVTMGCYGMTVTSIYRVNDGIGLTNGKTALYTAISTELCGIDQNLPRGQYVIAGSIISDGGHGLVSPVVDACTSLVIDWDELKTRQEYKNDRDAIANLENMCDSL